MSFAPSWGCDGCKLAVLSPPNRGAHGHSPCPRLSPGASAQPSTAQEELECSPQRQEEPVSPSVSTGQILSVLGAHKGINHPGIQTMLLERFQE